MMILKLRRMLLILKKDVIDLDMAETVIEVPEDKLAEKTIVQDNLDNNPDKDDIDDLK